MMAALYVVDVRTINEHKRIYSDGGINRIGNYPENPDSSNGNDA